MNWAALFHSEHTKSTYALWGGSYAGKKVFHSKVRPSNAITNTFPKGIPWHLRRKRVIPAGSKCTPARVTTMACNITRGFSPRRRGRKIVRDGRETEKRDGEGAVMVFPAKRRVPRHIPTDVYTIGWKFSRRYSGREGYCACGIRRKVGGREREIVPMLLVVGEFGIVSWRGIGTKSKKFDLKVGVVSRRFLCERVWV